MAEKRGRLGP